MLRLAVFFFLSLLSGCLFFESDSTLNVESDAQELGATLRVVHLNSNIPIVDVFIDPTEPLVSGLPFSKSTQPLELDAGQLSIQVSEPGSSEALVTLDKLLFETGKKYTAFVYGDIPAIELNTVEDSTQGLPSAQVRLRVIHALTGVNNVDVYAFLPTGREQLAEKLRFGSAADSVDLPAEAFLVGVDSDADGLSDLIFEIPKLDSGSLVNVFATSDVNGPFLLAQLPNGDVVRLNPVGPQLRVVNLSPTDIQPLLDTDSPEGFGAISFGMSTDYAPVPANSTLDITLDGTPTTSQVKLPLPLNPGTAYTAVAFADADGIQTTFFDDDPRGLGEQDVRIRVIHGAADIEEVDILTLGSENKWTVLLSDIEFGTVANPFDVPAGILTLGLDLNDDGLPEQVFELPNLSAGTLVNIFAATDDSQQTYLLAQFDGNVITRIDSSKSRIRILHLSRDAGLLTVYTEDADTLVTELAFTNQTNYIPLPSGQISLRITNQDSGAQFTDVLLPNRDHVIVVYDEAITLKTLFLEDDLTQLAEGNIRLPVTHVAPSVERGDVYELLDGGTRFGTQLVDNFGFGETQLPPDLPAARYTIGFDAGAVNRIAESFTLPFFTPNTFLRLYVYNETNGDVAVLIQQAEEIISIPRNPSSTD